MRLWQTNLFRDGLMVRGEGCRLWDAGGRSYLDLLSGTWCSVLGYGHVKWREIVLEQVSRLVHIGPPFLTAEVNAGLEALSRILPLELNRAVFLNTGSEAVELAVKMARAATGADGMAVVEHGYYGATSYALKLSEVGRDAGYLPGMGEIYRLPLPDCSKCSMGCNRSSGEFSCLEELERLTGDSTKLAGVVYEPVMVRAGVVVPPEGYGKRVKELVSRCGALLISEEVTTGMGRTGKWFGFMHEEMVPDILVIGKAVGAGMPVAAVVTTAEVEERSCAVLGAHVQSHMNDPFSGRVAAGVISIMEEEGLVEQSRLRGEYLRDGLERLKEKHPGVIVNVRGVGLVAGVELSEKAAGRGVEMENRLFEAGFIVNFQAPAKTFRLFPPFTISEGEIDMFLEAFEGVLPGV